jgi:hypothetical protein
MIHTKIAQKINTTTTTTTTTTHDHDHDQDYHHINFKHSTHTRGPERIGGGHWCRI